MEDRIRYLGLSDVFQLYDNYKMCLTEDELQWLPSAIQAERNGHQFVRPDTLRRHSSYNDDYDNTQISWSRQKPIAYDDDDTYDNFYMQREDEYREEYGDDYEDAIDDAWEDHQRNKR